MKSKKIFGFDLLRKQVRDAVENNLSEIDEWALGESEIERLFHASLMCLIDYGRREFTGITFASNVEVARELRDGTHPESRYTDLILESQVKIGEYRVDFVISAWTASGRVYDRTHGFLSGEPRWRKLVVECDGHDFHERTKEQAASDRSRDRALNALGYDVFRFTGSELWRDPWECAEQVYEWAIRGW